METRLRLVIFSLFLTAMIAAYVLWGDLLRFENLKDHRAALESYTERHYMLSATLFTLVLISTAFFVPAALVLSISGGFLFGVLPAVILIDVGMTAGATLAFLAARYVFGGWLQRTYGRRLKAFNEEIGRHGPNYLIVLRVIPVMPFFAVNYLAAMTRMTLARFVVATLLGVLPGAFVYAYAGAQLSVIESIDELFSVKIFLVFVVIALFTLLPVIRSHWKRLRGRPGV